MQSPISPLLGEVGKLITDEVKDAIDRMIELANGTLAENLTPNTERLTPAQLTPGSLARRAISEDGARRGEAQIPAQQIPNTVRVYLRPPKLFSVEYIINSALGTPGADIDCYETTESASEKLQSAKDRELGIDHSGLLANCEQQFKDALPIAIERLFELAAGITLQCTRYGKPYTITCKPNCRAIEFIADRVLGRSSSVLGDLRTIFENPDVEREYTREDIEVMTQAERMALRDALMRAHAEKEKTNSNSPAWDTEDDPSNSPYASVCGTASLTSNRPPSTVYGRGIEGEGYKGEGYKAGVGDSHYASLTSNRPPSTVYGRGIEGEGYKGEGYKAGVGDSHYASLTSNRPPSTVYGRGIEGEGYKGEGYKAGVGDSHYASLPSNRPPSPKIGRGIEGEGYKGEGYKAGVGDSHYASLPSNRPPSPKIGRGIEGEGYTRGDGGGGTSSTLPVYISTANKQLTDFLPTAINHMKRLARRAELIIQTESERIATTYEPDPRANVFLISRFKGAPTKYVEIEKIVAKTKYEKTIERLSAPQADYRQLTENRLALTILVGWEHIQ